jgi:hypothetical protein
MTATTFDTFGAHYSGWDDYHALEIFYRRSLEHDRDHYEAIHNLDAQAYWPR